MFSYPLDHNSILRKRKSLKRMLLGSLDSSSEQNVFSPPPQGFLSKRIAILGGSSTHELKEILELFLLDKGIQPDFYESEYNQYYEDGIFSNPKLDSFEPEIVYIHTTSLNLKIPPFFPDYESLEQAALTEFKRLESIHTALKKRFNCVVIQNNFELLEHRNLGSLDGVLGRLAFIQALNTLLSKNLQKGVYIHDILGLSARMGLDKWSDFALYCQAKYAMSMEGMVECAFSLSHLIGAICGKSKKVLALDLDNTCWGGVIGDDGLGGIAIGDESALGEAYSAFQKYAKELRDRGVILGVCSKNEIQNAREGFKHPRSVLKNEDFSAFYANWEPKNLNLENMARELNLGLDSFVFIDDNPAERLIVGENLKSVSVPDVGSDVLEFIKHIDRNGYFECISLAKEDLERAQSYAENAMRAQVQSEFSNYDDFLKSLQMEAEIDAFRPIYLERITQLINKTNQFNTTTRRYEYAQVEQMSQDDRVIAIYGRLRDKFGDNGLIAVSVGHIAGDICEIDLWLMSCRVLKRGMEGAMMDEFVARAKAKGVRLVRGIYSKTAKNAMVSKLYGELGFTCVSEQPEQSVWELEIQDYQNQNQFIGVRYAEK